MKGCNELQDRVRNDEAFAEKIIGLAESGLSPEEGLAAVRELGYDITLDEWIKNSAPPSAEHLSHGELNETELTQVTGGLTQSSGECILQWNDDWSAITLTNRPNSIRCHRPTCVHPIHWACWCACRGSSHCVNKMHNLEYWDLGSEIHVVGGYNCVKRIKILPK